MNGRTAGRMGMFKLEAVYGLLPDQVFRAPVKQWEPMGISATIKEAAGAAVELPFKIGGLVLPMVTHNEVYSTAVQALARTVENYYGDTPFFPIVSSGETCDALGYGSDVHAALTAHGLREGHYFVHRSGETYKRSSAYADRILFERIRRAKKAGATPIIVAVGGGINGNCIGLIAAITGADFVEVPTTPMHYNDATTSAKKAFSLVKNDVILSKNILGAFYLPKLVFCVSEMFISLNSANAHATVGEATKTMNMLGVANSAVGATDYHNILGGVEFASDFTRILKHVGGFEKLVSFIQDDDTLRLRAQVETLGMEIRTQRESLTNPRGVRRRSTTGRTRGARGFSKRGVAQHLDQAEGLELVYTAKGQLKSSASIAQLWKLGAGSESASPSAINLAALAIDAPPATTSTASVGTGTLSDDYVNDSLESNLDDTTGPSSNSEEDEDEDEEGAEHLRGLMTQRAELMRGFRARFHGLAEEDKADIKAFLTTINLEVVKAKAMFLAYSDPFEKYRALLFEYAHTLGHGVEAFANMLYTRARREGVPIPPDAFRLHGQCVGMAVLWAGAMSEQLGVLDGQGLRLHQSLVYLFNRHGGFAFAPLRRLCESLGVTCADLCEGVLRVVRRDNKRGYCACSSSTASVDQLVAGRPGKMLRSADPAAELRYLVEVDEALQVTVLQRAWEGEFDLVADLPAEEGGEVVFRKLVEGAHPDDKAAYATPSKQVGNAVHAAVHQMYADDTADPAAAAQLQKLQQAAVKVAPAPTTACCGDHAVSA